MRLLLSKNLSRLQKENGVKTSFTLSDPFCVGRHKDVFLELLPDIDILFANEEEAKMLFGDEVNAPCEIVAITKGAEGAEVYSDGKHFKVATQSVENLVDTTGAGDLFAAGFLYGYTQGKSLDECARLGNASAGQIVQQLGARPQKPLKELAA